VASKGDKQVNRSEGSWAYRVKDGLLPELELSGWKIWVSLAQGQTLKLCVRTLGGGDPEPTEAQLERRSRRHSTAEAGQVRFPKADVSACMTQK
jgi:hypothetical protein